MKFLIPFLFFVPFAFGQGVKISQKTQFDVSRLIALTPEIEKENKTVLDLYPIMKMNGTHYVSFLGKKGTGVLAQQDGIVFGKQTGSIVSVRVALEKLPQLQAIQGIEFLELAGKIKPTLDKVVFDTRVDSVHAGIGLPEIYSGKDVFIGITDWGFDYSSPMFYDTLLQETRIFAAWDQFKTSGPAPSGYSYGTVYDSPAEFIAAGADTANQYSYATHGTHVAGIAGGSGAGLQYRGMAFESQYLFTTFLVDEAAVLDAWDWMYDIADAEDKRLVMNQSWGLYHFGTLDGNSLLSQAITDMTDLGVVFVNSGGNNGNVNFHLDKTFDNDSIKTLVSFYSYAANEFMWGQSLHFWGEQGKDFEVKLEVLTSSNNFLVQSEWFPASLNGYLDSFLVTGIDTIWYNVAAEASHPLNSRPTMRLRVKKTNTGLKLIMHSKAIDGKVHMWNVTELTTDVGNWGMSFASNGIGYSAGNSNYGVSEPAASDDVIAVAAHASEYMSGANLVGGTRATFSSKGPRYDEVLKPDISAPGSNVASSISSYTDNDFTPLTTVEFNGRTYPFSKFSGTSMSSPAVTGICALMLDANPYLSARQVKEIITETARLDQHTGVIGPEGSPLWGHGKINAYAAIQLALITVGTQEIVDELRWNVYPNPSSNMFTLEGISTIESAQVIDMLGKETTVEISNHQLNVSNLSAGSYVLRIVSEGKVFQKKVQVIR